MSSVPLRTPVTEAEISERRRHDTYVRFSDVTYVGCFVQMTNLPIKPVQLVTNPFGTNKIKIVVIRNTRKITSNKFKY